MSLALYRKYRSRSLSEIVGQDHVTDLLARAVKQGKIAHAYLFTGPKGVGKTSIARILAHEINGLPYTDDSIHLDIIEIDAASNNGIEDIRDLRERVQIAPVSAKKKIYIIDEVHMLSKPAFNALLKTLEEPPEHVVFILATTDIDKVPETILSRTQRHSFRRASEPAIVSNLKRIAKAEKLTVDEDALKLIAHHADGSFRDSVSLFDQLSSGLGEKDVLTSSMVRSSLGMASDEAVTKLKYAVDTGDITAINSHLVELEDAGTPTRTLVVQLIHLLRQSMSESPRYAQLIDDLLDVSKSSSPELKLLTTLCLFNPAQVATSAPKPAQEPNNEPKTASEAPSVKPEPPKKPAKSPKSAKSNVDFSWDELIKHVRTHNVALHSVLAKCDYELEGQTLVIYTKSAFYKRKLDDSKYRAVLNSSLKAIGSEDIEVETKATAAPMKNSQAAKVAAIMGGGEEVSVDDA